MKLNLTRRRRRQHLNVNESPNSIHVLSVQLDVVMPCPLHPEGLDCVRGCLVNCQAVGEINDLIVTAMDDQNLGVHSSHLVNAAQGERERVG